MEPMVFSKLPTPFAAPGPELFAFTFALSVGHSIQGRVADKLDDTKVAPPSVLLFGAEYTVRGPMLSRLPLLNTIDPGTAVRAGCSSVMPGNVSFEFTAAPRSTIPSAWSVTVQTSPVQVRGPVVTL
jgi:hypothetical protein